MNKALMGGGLGLLLLLGGLYFSGLEKKEEVQPITPAMEAGYRAANTANLAALSMARVVYAQHKERAPEKIEDLVPEFLPTVPSEAFSKSSAVTGVYDGKGGWVLDADGFRPNHPQTL